MAIVGSGYIAVELARRVRRAWVTRSTVVVRGATLLRDFDVMLGAAAMRGLQDAGAEIVADSLSAGAVAQCRWRAGAAPCRTGGAWGPSIA